MSAAGAVCRLSDQESRLPVLAARSWSADRALQFRFHGVSGTAAGPVGDGRTLSRVGGLRLSQFPHRAPGKPSVFGVSWNSDML